MLINLLAIAPKISASPPAGAFSAGLNAYRNGDYSLAAEAFQKSVAQQPSSGALHNLGNAQWQRGRVGEAVLAWEQALWLNPLDRNARNNLQFARDAAQLESPELRWYEIASSWLPTHWWGWLAGFSLWLAVGALVVPNVLRWRRSPWLQAVAALGLGVFILCIPAHLGTLSRTHIGFVLGKETTLRLTPTSGAEIVTRLAAGDPVRRVRKRGSYVLVRTSRAVGWLHRDELGWIASDLKAQSRR